MAKSVRWTGTRFCSTVSAERVISLNVTLPADHRSTPVQGVRPARPGGQTELQVTSWGVLHPDCLRAAFKGSDRVASYFVGRPAPRLSSSRLTYLRIRQSIRNQVPNRRVTRLNHAATATHVKSVSRPVRGNPTSEPPANQPESPGPRRQTCLANEPAVRWVALPPDPSVKQKKAFLIAPVTWPLDRKNPAPKHSDGFLNSGGAETRTRFGDARASTTEQHHDLQRDVLKRAGCAKIIDDTTSGG
jgi:hypothetical protein